MRHPISYAFTITRGRENRREKKRQVSDSEGNLNFVLGVLRFALALRQVDFQQNQQSGRDKNDEG